MTEAMRRALPALLLSACLGALLLVRAPSSPMVDPDSHLYLSWGATVPLLYPIFVHIFSGWWIIAAQVSLYAVAVFILASFVLHLRGGRLLAPLAVVAMFINPQVDGLLFSILSEGLFLPLFVLLIALVVGFAASGRKRMAFWGALVAGLCAATRPASMPVGIAVSLACLLRWEGRGWAERMRMALCCLAIWTAVIGVERVGSYAVHGSEATSLTGPHLFGKASLLDVPDPLRGDHSPREILTARAMQDDFAPVRRLLKSQRGTVAYPPLLAFYEVCIEHNCSRRLRSQLALPEASANTLLAEVALKRVEQNPRGYLELAWDEYKSLWVFGVRSHPALGRAYDAQIARLRPMPLEAFVAPQMTMPSSPSRLTLLTRPMFMVIGAIVALLCLVLPMVLLARRCPSEVALPSLFAALCTEGIMVFTALAGIGDGRYTMGMWPGIAAALVLAVPVLLQAGKLISPMRKS